MVKKLVTLFAAILIVVSVFAQVPQKMSYQAIIRNSYNVLVTNKKVSMKISILQNQTPVYVELQTTTTNENGLINVEIGNGIVLTGVFANLNWGKGVYYIKTETDPDGGTYYSIVGTSELLSVPYALYSTTSGSGSGATIDDTSVSTTTTWSSFKINSQFGTSGTGVGIDDASILNSKTWSSLKINSELGNKVNTTALATVATTGSFSDLKNKPTTLAGYGITDGGSIGNGTGTSVTMSGDATMNTTGVVKISNNAINSNKIMDGAVEDQDLDKSNIPLSGFATPEANISMGGYKLTNLSDPTSSKDAATKYYVDNAISSSSSSGSSTFVPVMSLDNNMNLSMRGGNAISLADLYQSLSLAGTILSISGPRDSHVDLAAIIAAGSGGGSGVVVHDATLTGTGTSSNVLGLAPQAITPTKMTGIYSNGNSGQVLTSTGNGSFSWTDPASGSGGGLSAVNVNPNNGITASVTNVLPTSIITLGLGAITPTSVTTGAVTATGLKLTTGVTTGYVLTADNAGNATWQPASSSSAVETDPMVKAITGIVKSNGTTITAAIPGTDYLLPAMTSNRLLGSGLAGTSASEITLGTNLSFTGNTLNATGGGGGVTAVTANNGMTGAIVGSTLTIGLGAITPTSVNTPGTVTATGFNGPLTGNAATATTATNISGGGAGLVYQSAANTTTQILNTSAAAGNVLTWTGGPAPVWQAPAAAGIATITPANGITAVPAGNVVTLGLGAITPTSISTGAITSTGTVTATGLKLTTGASNGYVLKSDAAGVATWQAATSSYKGMWDASANSPSIANGTGAIGDYYIISVGGTNLTPATTFTQGGQAVYNGSVWQSVSASIVETDPIVKAINGIVYSNGTTISALTLGTNLSLTGTTLNASGGAANLTYVASATQGLVNSSTGTGTALPAATAVNAGLLLPADFSKVSKIASYAAADVTKVLTVDATGAAIWAAPSGGATNLTYVASATQGLVNSSTGTGTALPAATAVNAGLLLPADFSKVSKIASYAAADANKVLTVNAAGSSVWVTPAVTNLTYVASATQGLVNSSTGTGTAVPAATAVNAGLLLPADFAKVSKITTYTAADANKVLTVDATGAATWQTPSSGTATVVPGIQPAGPAYGTPPRTITAASPIVWGPNDVNVILLTGFTGTINFPSASANPGRIVGVNNRSGGTRLLLNTSGGDTGVYTDESWTSISGSSGMVTVISDGVSWRLYAGRP